MSQDNARYEEDFLADDYSDEEASAPELLDDLDSQSSGSCSCSRDLGDRKRSPEARDAREEHYTGKKPEDPLESFFSSRPIDGKRNASPAKAPAPADDPLADFYSDRPKVKDFEDPEEALRKRKQRNNAAASSPPRERVGTGRGAPRRAPSPAPARHDTRGATRRAPSPAPAKHDARRQQVRRRSRSRRAGGGGGSRRPASKVDEFCKANNLDEKIQAMMRQMDAADADAVMDQGWDLQSTRNPNAVVVSRVQKLERETGRSIRNPSPGRGTGGARQDRERRGRDRRGHEPAVASRRAQAKGRSPRRSRKIMTASRQSNRDTADERKVSTSRVVHGHRHRRAAVDDDTGRRKRRRH